MAVLKRKSDLARIGLVNAPMPVDPDTGEQIERPRDSRTSIDDQINGELRDNLGSELDNLVSRAEIKITEDGKSAILTDLVQIHQINFNIGNGYLVIGQLLLGIYNRSREVYDEIVSPYARVLPIGHNVALKLRRIAEEVNRRGIDLQSFPSAYTTIYEIVTLEERTYNRVMQEKLIHPKIQREEIKKWKKAPLISAVDNSVSAFKAKLEEKIREKDRLIDEHENRIRKIDREIAEIRQQIAAGESDG